MSIYIIEGRYYNTVKHCRWCGGADLPEHSKYKGKCIDCGNRYNRYATKRNLRQKGTLTLRNATMHFDQCIEYVHLREAGMRVPKTIDEELKAVEAYINERM